MRAPSELTREFLIKRSLKRPKEIVWKFFTMFVHHKIPGEKERAQNYTGTPTPTQWNLECNLKMPLVQTVWNPIRICSCFVDILAALHFNFARSLYLGFCLQSVDTVRQIFPFFIWKPLVDICVWPALSGHLSKLWTVLSCIELYAWLLCFVKYVQSVNTHVVQG